MQKIAAMGLKEALEFLAQKVNCSRIDMSAYSEFARVWIVAVVFGIMLLAAAMTPIFWCKSEKNSEDTKRLADTLRLKSKQDIENNPSSQAAQQHSGNSPVPDDLKTDPGAALAGESRCGSPSPSDYRAGSPGPGGMGYVKSIKPDKQDALEHLRRTSVTEGGTQWRNPFTTPMHKMSEVGGTGMELYFHMLRNLGLCFAVMAALSFPLTAFSSLGTFAPDVGQALAKYTIGNIGSLVPVDKLAPSERVVTIGCQGIMLSSVTYVFGWLDFSSAIVFLLFVSYFRFYRIPKSAREDDEESVTCTDFAVEIDHLPSTILQQREYEKLLKEHILNRLTVVRQQRKCKVEDLPEVKEIVFVRDYRGRLGSLKQRAQLVERQEILECYKEPEKPVDDRGNLKIIKQIEKIGQKIAKIDKHMQTELGEEEELPIVRAFAILGMCEDVTNLLYDYRFAQYSIFRLLQWQDRRFQGHKIRISRAPQPSDLIWENQDVHWFSRLVRRLIMLVIFLIIICISLVLIYVTTASAASQAKTQLSYIGVASCDPNLPQVTSESNFKCIVTNATVWDRNWAASQGTDYSDCFCLAQGYAKIVKDSDLLKFCESWLLNTAKSLGINGGASIIVLVINIILQMVLLAMAQFERPLSYTALNSSMMEKVFLAQTINTGYVMLVVSLYGPEALRNAASHIPGIGQFLFQGSYNDLTRAWYTQVGIALMTNMLLNMIIPATMSIVNMIVVWLTRWWKTRTITVKHQAELIELFTNPDFDIKAKYAQLLTTVFVTMTYNSGMPLLNVFACFYMLFMYWADKIVLLWGSRRPPLYDAQMGKEASGLMLYAVAIHCVFAIAMFGQPCVFPSPPEGGDFDKAREQVPQGFFSEWSPRVSTRSTWMLFALLLVLIALWAVWHVLWFLGSTFGELWKCFVVCLCPHRAVKVASADIAASMTWEIASEIIEGSFPPASYRLDRHPEMMRLASKLRETGRHSAAAARSPTPLSDAGRKSPSPQPEAVGKSVEMPPTSPELNKAPVEKDIAKAFIKALRAEYVEGQDQAVGKFFDEANLDLAKRDRLERVEEEVRNASNRQDKVSHLAEQWGLDLSMQSA